MPFKNEAYFLKNEAFLLQMSKKKKKTNVINNMKKRNESLGSLKTKVCFSVSCLSFKVFFKPDFAAYILILIFSLLLIFNIKERESKYC